MRSAVLGTLVTSFVLLWLLVPLASGVGADPPGGGGGVTEDNDNDGVPNNVVDEDDNLHPSGKDRSVEHGQSGDQGKSPSDPDREENGGPDKPGEAGGLDVEDQDRNNGCGNDDDFEDDNNGNCFGVTTTVPQVETFTEATTTTTTTTTLQPSGPAVLGVQIEQPAAPQAAPAQVAGVQMARTGSGIQDLAGLGIALFLIGLIVAVTCRLRPTEA
jgi:hypothetical protein